ncbi:hypothetical protein Tco_1310403 [Tanacetum coccineum]
MSNPANDDFSQHLNDGEESNHEDASDTGAAPKQPPTNDSQTTCYLKFKLLHSEEEITAAEIQAVKKERKAKNILLMAIPKEHMRRFHGMNDAKEIWEAIRTRFGAHGAEVSTEDANHKFLRSLPPTWSNLAMTMRTKPDVDTLSIDDLYNNLKVFDQEIQGASKTSSSAQNVAFVSQSKSSTNKVKSGLLVPTVLALLLLLQPIFQKKKLLLIDDLDIEEMDINWQIAMIAIRMKKFYKKTGRRGEHTEVEEINHALMAINSSSEVSLCSKTCIDSYNTLKTLCDEQMNQLGDQEAQILAYSQAVKKLEAQLVTFQKQQLSLNEKLTFQANEIYEKDEKLKRYRRIGMKAVKEKEQLQKTLDSWKDSSKNLWRLINSGMSSNNKLGLGYEIQSNNEVLSYEEEMNFSMFNCSKEDLVGKHLYSRFTKTNDFKGVLHPLSGDYTPTPQEEIDESLYVYCKKGPQEPKPNVSDDRSSEYSTCQSNDSARSIGTSSEHSVDPESEISSVPLEVYVSTPVTTNEKDVSGPKTKEIDPSCISYIKTPRQPIKDQATPKVNRKNWNPMMERELGEGYSFTKKKCFVCGSLSHLIKDCDYYEKKMAREAEVKKQRVFNTGNGVAKPVWTNANRVNHANKFVPRSVQLNVSKPNINSVRPNINTGRTNINPVRPRVNIGSSNVTTVRTRQSVPTKTSNSFSPKRPQVNQFNQRGHFSKSYSSVRRPFAKTTNAVMGSWGSAVKSSASYNWRNPRPNFNYNSGPTFIRTVNANGPQGRPKPAKAWVPKRN